MNVLVVDDHPDTAEALEALFSLHGHTVRASADPLDALAAIRDFEPDVAVLDIGLPTLDGYELAQHLRVNGVGCPFVVVSGSAPRDKALAARLGIVDHLRKPVDFDALLHVVEQGALRPL